MNAYSITITIISICIGSIGLLISPSYLKNNEESWKTLSFGHYINLNLTQSVFDLFLYLIKASLKNK